MFRTQFTRALTLAVIGSLLTSTAVFADNTQADGDGLEPFTSNPNVAFGDVCRSGATSKPVLVRIDRQSSGTNVFANSSVVSFSVASSNAKISATTPASFTLPSDWETLGFDAFSETTSTTVTVNSASAGAANGTVTVTANGVNGDGKAISRPVDLAITANVLGTACDSTPPVLSLPANITAEATSASGAVVTYTATASDANPTNPTVTCSPLSGATFPLGTTTVNCSSTDTAGNTANGSFTITVQDTTAPVVTPPTNISVEATGPGGAVVTYSGASATDLVDGSVATSCEPASGSTFPLGANTVTCSATDNASNTGTATFTITVSDTTAPILSVPGNMTEEATGPDGAAVSFSASASDLVDGDIAATCDPASGSTFALGTTTVDCSATDEAGNTTSDSFTITVEDTTAPAVTAPANQTVEATGPSGAVATYSGQSATDIVDGSVATSCDPASGSTFALGANTVTCSATDGAGNTGTATFTITVVDTTPPALTLPADAVLEAAGPGGASATFSASASDLVDGSVATSCDPASGSTFALGTTTVTCSATDEAGNLAQGSFTITVEDTTAPDVSAPADQTVEATGPAGAIATYSGESATDIVDGSVPTSCDPASGSTFALGATTVTCSATDDAGNTGTADFTITVVDTTAPTITVPANITVAGSSLSGATVSYVASASDLVDGIIAPSCSPASGSTFGFGTTTVTCSATDDAGNTANATFTVTVTFGRSGFYAPVDMGTLNMIKGGQTVPLKFEVFAGATEVTTTSVVSYFRYKEVACGSLDVAGQDDIEMVTSGGTVLRYDTTGGQFIQNWQTPKTTGKCYVATVGLTDGTSISAYFKTK